MSMMYDEGYALFERKPELTVDELVACALAQAVTRRTQDEFCNGYNAARLEQTLDVRRFV